MNDQNPSDPWTGADQLTEEDLRWIQIQYRLDWSTAWALGALVTHHWFGWWGIPMGFLLAELIFPTPWRATIYGWRKISKKKAAAQALREARKGK